MSQSKKEIARLRAALEDIANPLEKLRKEAAARGARLDGIAAVMLSDDPNWLKQKARKALEGGEP
jgi:hypothetical protein